MAISDQQSIDEFRKLRDERERLENLIHTDAEPGQINQWKTDLRNINQALADHLDLPPYEND